MSKNWYKTKSSNKSRRSPIVLGDSDGFMWEDTNLINNSYNIVTVKLASKTHHFYLWSAKTVKTARVLYDDGNLDKSLKMLKKYAFDVNTIEDE
jgi:hypothetical protein